MVGRQGGILSRICGTIAMAGFVNDIITCLCAVCYDLLAMRGEWLAHRTALPRAKFSISSRKCLHNASVAILEFPLLPRVWILQPRRRLLGTDAFLSSPQRDSLQSCRCQGSPVADKEAARVRFPCNHVGVRVASLHRLVVKCGGSDYNFDDYSSVDLKYCGGAASWGGRSGE